MSEMPLEEESETCCKLCHREYELRDGQDPTKYCDECAQEVVAKLERELDEAKEEIKWLKRELDAIEPSRVQWKAMAQEFSELLHGQYVKTSDIQNRFYAMRDGLK